jgi:hypothetical protein
MHVHTTTVSVTLTIQFFNTLIKLGFIEKENSHISGFSLFLQVSYSANAPDCLSIDHHNLY